MGRLVLEEQIHGMSTQDPAKLPVVLAITSRSLAGVILLSSQYFQPFEELTKAVSDEQKASQKEVPTLRI